MASSFHTIGHITRDRVGGAGGGREQAGGAAHYAALTLARLGERVAVTTRMAPRDRPALLAELQAAGAEVTARQDMLASRPRAGACVPEGNTLPRSPGVVAHARGMARVAPSHAI